ARQGSDFLHNLLAFYDLTEDGVAVIQPTRRRKRDEELAAVCTRARVGHRQLAGLVERHAFSEFVFELVAGSAGAGAKRTAALDHEVRNDAMERQAIIKGPLGRLASLWIGELFRSGREAHKILHGLRSMLLK